MIENETNIAGPEELLKDNKICQNTLIGNLGIRYTYESDQRIEAEMPVDERTIQPHGYLHGGATIALAETLAGLGSQRLCDEGEMAVGQQINACHVRPVKMPSKVKAVAKIYHKGKKTHVWDVEVFNVDGKPISTIRVVNFIVKKNG